MNILVSGGTGYIGSHTCVALLQSGYEVIIVDNLTNSSKETIKRIEEIANKPVKFYKIDATNIELMDNVFKENNIEGVIHFAGFKSVAESIQKPNKYYFNNIVSLLTIIEKCQKYHVNKLVFSSSATVYGDNIAPFTENMQLLKTTNPYGETKAICERILIDEAYSNVDLQVSILRYFNPVGAHKSGLIGEKPNGIPNNLMPYITQVAKGRLERLQIFGNDYTTNDGTGVRDYIHVVDLAEGHVAALKSLRNGVEIFNLGTGKGTSVLELIKAFEKANNIFIPYEFANRRYGDIDISYANVEKAKRKLNWSAQKSVFDMVRDAWNFERLN